ncbi:3',5'-cyclic-nucleotide phosphodiesterase regA [Psilocybe cubensis]|uniref:Phosphodiesterase n=2 Tax=Psilocybe cubensis TaxID=181762 RepID=A0A8H7XWV5_PSICU|nr:3',5'-cyclic-nucleotide phosphodiesterase regA [Psilocybe cubensis]KAH9478702.1 3',5'-cyclic-nucleotide phosphodiesterase regA [Psilocybe cubensis]
MCRAIHLEAAQAQAPSPVQKQSPAVLAHTHAYPRDWRRRSADVGGLARALASAAVSMNGGGMGEDDELSGFGGAMGGVHGEEEWGAGVQGQGWMGGEPGEIATEYAELLSDMYTQTMSSVNDNNVETLPPSISDSKRTKLIWALDRWHFEPHLLEEDEVIACTILIFEALFRVEGMQEAVPVSMQQITSFIHHLRRIYRYENTYHNFEHALDVLQATQSYLKSAGVVPPPSFLLEAPGRRWTPRKGLNDGGGTLIASLGRRELFMLYVAAIGHDVGHPGFSNHFMKNAHTPLAQLYPSGSALEHLHIQLLLRVMRAHGLASVLLDSPADGAHLRKVLVQSVLATDMGVHDAFMETLRNCVEGGKGSLCHRQIVLCQAILKNADISNPTRPFLVSKHWASLLSHEWSAQASLESSYHLTPTVQPFSASPRALAASQIFFISRYAKPLLELTEKAVPEMRMYREWCRKNLKEWEQRKRGVEKEEKEEQEREEKAREREERRRRNRGLETDADDGSMGTGTSASPSAVSSVPSSIPSTPGMQPTAVPVSLQAAVAAVNASGGSAAGTTPTPTPLPLTHNQSYLPPPPPQLIMTPGSPRIPGFTSAFPLTLPTHHPPALALSVVSSTAYSSYPSSSRSSSSASSSVGSEKARVNGVGVEDALLTIPIPPSSPSFSVSDDASEAASVPFSPLSETSGSFATRAAGGSTPTQIPPLSVHALGGSLAVNGGYGHSKQSAAVTAQAAARALRAASKAGSMRKRSQMNLNASAHAHAHALENLTMSMRFVGVNGGGGGGDENVNGHGLANGVIEDGKANEPLPPPLVDKFATVGRKIKAKTRTNVRAARNSWCAGTSGVGFGNVFFGFTNVGSSVDGNAHATANGSEISNAGSDEDKDSEKDVNGSGPPPSSAPPNVGVGTAGGALKPLPLKAMKLQVSP